MERLRDPNEAPKPHLFQDARRIVLDWLNSDRIVCKEGTQRAQLLYRQMTEEVIDRLTGALVDQAGGSTLIRPVMDPFQVEASTADVSLTTPKDVWKADPAKCHLNWTICDSKWEALVAQAIEKHPRVTAYAKTDGMGWEIPYAMAGDQRSYRPDFLLRLDDGTTLIIEVKGFRGHDAVLKAETVRNRWLPAINGAERWGRWAFAELRAIQDATPDLDAAIRAALRTEEPA